MMRTWLSHDFSPAHTNSFYHNALHTFTLMVKQTLSPSIKVFLQYRLRISTVGNSIFHIDVGILRILRPWIAFETPVLFVCINPSIFTTKYITNLQRPTFINLYLGSGWVGTMSVAYSGAQVFTASNSRTKLLHIGVLLINYQLRLLTQNKCW